MEQGRGQEDGLQDARQRPNSPVVLREGGGRRQKTDRKGRQQPVKAKRLRPLIEKLKKKKKPNQLKGKLQGNYLQRKWDVSFFFIHEVLKKL